MGGMTSLLAALPLLAQAPSEATAAPPAGRILLWLAAIAALAAALGFAALVIRRRSLAPGPPAIGFTLADLRDMHREGQLSDEEFEAAKAKILGETRAGLAEGSGEPGRPEGVMRPAGDGGISGGWPADNADPAGDASN